MSGYKKNGDIPRYSGEEMPGSDYFENSAADFMDILTEDNEDFLEELSNPAPIKPARSQIYSERPPWQDRDLRSSLPNNRYPHDSKWRNDTDSNIRQSGPGNVINPKLLSNPPLIHSQNGTLTGKNPNFYESPYNPIPHGSSLATPPQNPNSYSSASSSSATTQSDPPSTTPWTTSETQTLQQLRSLDRSYAFIAQQLPGRSEASCRQRQSRLTQRRSNRGKEGGEDDGGEEEADSGTGRRKRWTAMEDEVLADVVGGGGSFEEAARVLEGRSANACRSRYYEYLGPWRTRQTHN